jgi:hypothetical protein
MFENAPKKKDDAEGQRKMTRRDLFRNALRTGLGITAGVSIGAGSTIGGTEVLKKGAEALAERALRAVDKVQEENERQEKITPPDVHKA